MPFQSGNGDKATKKIAKPGLLRASSLPREGRRRDKPVAIFGRQLQCCHWCCRPVAFSVRAETLPYRSGMSPYHVDRSAVDTAFRPPPQTGSSDVSILLPPLPPRRASRQGSPCPLLPVNGRLAPDASQGCSGRVANSGIAAIVIATLTI